ncbi:MAG TPA: hypothetical protein DCQ50_11755 [Chryseobacterium sp.]|nr:hypothetical protein [Chryseobacterium sp.]
MVTQNQKAGLALARGFIVFIMPAVHSVWLYSANDVKQGWLGISLGFLAEGPGAQSFMLLMGVFIVLGRPKTNKQIFSRSLIIFLMGYLLNLFKLVIPYYAGWIPEKFLTDNQFAVDAMLPLNLLLVGDILQFAAIAYLACSLINKVRKSAIVTIILIVFVLIASPVVWEFSANGFAGTKTLSLFNGSPPYVFFPVFPWLFYPLSGLLGARVMKKYSSNTDVGVLFGIAGWLLVLGGYYITQYEPNSWNLTFYRLGTGGTIMHGGIVLLWLALFIWLPLVIRNNFFFRLLSWVSKHITVIYLVQWVVIIWMLPLFGYNQLNILKSLLAVFTTSTISFTLPLLFQKYLLKQKTKT